MKFKRLIAFIIDTFIVSMIASFIILIPVFNYDTEKQTNIYNEYTEKIRTNGSGILDIEEMSSAMYNYVNGGLSLNIISTALTFIYFGIIGYFLKGNTFGKKVMKIKVVPTKGEGLNPSLYILREVLLLGIIFKVIGIAITLLIKDTVVWYNIYSTITYLSSISSLIIYGFILFREDERGLHDLIGQTKVVSVG